MRKSKEKSIIKEKRDSRFIQKWAWIFSGPAIISQLIFGWFPISVAFVLAFQKYQFRGSPFVGLYNFKLVISSPITIIAFRNTLYYAALSIGLTFIIPILIAILLMEMKKNIIRVMMILWFIPTASMAGIVLWKYIYNVQYGLFNGILTWLGLPTLRWLNDPRLAMLCLVLPGLILFGPGLVYIATIQGIPNELYEAAELEGASLGQKICHVTLPRMRGIIAMMLVLAVIGNLQVFTQPYVMTQGGPNMATYSIVMYIFDLAFGTIKLGAATALAVLFFFVIMTLIIIQRRCFKENIDI